MRLHTENLAPTGKFDFSRRRKTPQTLPFPELNRGVIRPKYCGISGPSLVVAGSTLVAPANSSNRRRICLSKRHRPNYFAFSVNHRTLRKASPLADLSGVGSQIKEREGLRGNRFHRRPERSDCFGLSLFRRATLNWTSDYGESR
jgi:hypothetical protein